MIESTALATMEDIRTYCREVKLPCSETKILQMHREEAFPLSQLAGQYESDKGLITAWRKDRIIQQRIDADYIQERNQFVEQAATYADCMHGKDLPSKRGAKGRAAAIEWAEKWNRAYHAEINRLWSEYVQKKKIATEYAQEQAKLIYAEKLAELMKPTEE